MKQLLLLCAFVLTAGIATAQDAGAKKSCSKTCAKTCEKSKASASTDSQTKVASALSAADIVAEQDESIQKKVCDITGSVAYFQKSVCEKSGSVKMTEVHFDEAANSFVNVPQGEMMSAGKEGTAVKAASKSSDAKGQTKACCAGKKSCKKKEGTE
jgi:hypothetical protein